MHLLITPEYIKRIRYHDIKHIIEDIRFEDIPLDEKHHLEFKGCFAVPYDFSRFTNVVKITISNGSFDLTCDRLPLTSVKLMDIANFKPIGNVNRKIPKLNILYLIACTHRFRDEEENAYQERMRTFRDAFEDVVETISGAYSNVIPTMTRMYSTDVPLNIDQAREFLQTHPVCQAVYLRINNKEELKGAIQLYQEFEQLRPIQGQMTMTYSSSPHETLNRAFAEAISTMGRHGIRYVNVPTSARRHVPDDILGHLSSFAGPTGIEIYNMNKQVWYKAQGVEERSLFG